MQSFQLISVVITCYNQGEYLGDAIESVLAQTYQQFEIIVLDDGSTDSTKLVANKYSHVRYVHQANQGVSCARNNGVRNSLGQYICFLDADDWLLPNALETNLEFLLRNERAAFVSGAYQFAYEQPLQQYVIVDEPKEVITSDHYKYFLKGNYVGMHAAVLYPRWVFNEYEFDCALVGCEDYDLFLRISRRHPVIDHSILIAVYRRHQANTTNNNLMMLNSALLVLEKQKIYLETQEEVTSWKEGNRGWRSHYSNLSFEQLQNPRISEENRKRDLRLLWLNNKKLYFTYNLKKLKLSLRNSVKRLMPAFLVRAIKNLKSKPYNLPQPGNVNMGDFERLDPLSRSFGYDRGGPVDRYYIEKFLERCQHLVVGRILEIGDNEYTMKYGGAKVTKSDILHINEKNERATFVADLANAPQIPDGVFDCIILTQTLHLIYNYKDAIKTCHRILKPGGKLLVTVPGITSIDAGEWKSTWYWAFTDISVKRILDETFDQKNVNVDAFGNVLTATALLYGMGLLELKAHYLDHYDPSYQVIITAVATK